MHKPDSVEAVLSRLIPSALSEGSQSDIEAMIDEVIAANPSQVAEFQGGKEKLLSFFVGAVMKASKGKANPGQLNQILREKLKSA